MNIQNSDETPTVTPDTRIGIALGSGSARGWSHIGVLRALEEIGIVPGIVTGCSVGSLVGAAYASQRLDELENWVLGLTWKDILALMDVSLLEGGLIHGDKIIQYAQSLMGGIDIQDLPLKFAAVATDLHTGREVWLREGSVLDSIRASAALPGLFSPFETNGQWLVDGGLVDPVPVSLCRAMGAEIVIAVNLNGGLVGKHLQRNTRKPPVQKKRDPPKDNDLWSRISSQITTSFSEQKEAMLSQMLGRSRSGPGVFEVMASSINIMQDRVTRSRMAGDPPEITLTPRLAHLGLMEFDQAEMAIEEGRACVERMRPQLDQYLSLN